MTDCNCLQNLAPIFISQIDGASTAYQKQIDFLKEMLETKQSKIDELHDQIQKLNEKHQLRTEERSEELRRWDMEQQERFRQIEQEHQRFALLQADKANNKQATEPFSQTLKHYLQRKIQLDIIKELGSDDTEDK